MREMEQHDGLGRKLWLWVVVIAVAAVIGSVAAVFLSSPAPAALERTYEVVAYHWGFAIFDENGNEVPRIEVAQGTEVTLEVISGASLDHEAHHEYMQRTLEAWADNPAYGGRSAMELHELMEEAEAAGLNDHVMTIPAFGVVAVTDHDSATPAVVTFVADEMGTFDMVCAGLCGFGHQYMSLTGGLVVT
jgi:heme/copper-type cytochrome/quinol oxidase subunit 2